MSNFEAYKIIKGTANTYIWEDPVQGSNGTAVVTRINNFIDAIGESFQDILPGSRGSISTLNSNGQLEDFPVGTNGYCLVSDTSTSTGLAYQERVDVTTNQTIGGIKTFTGKTNFGAGGESTGIFNFLSDINVQGTTSSTNLVVNNGALLKGSTTQQGNLTVKGPSLFEANSVFQLNQTVQGSQLIGGSLEVGASTTLGQNLNVTGNTSIGGTLSIAGVANFSDTSTFAKDIYVQRNASITKDLTVNEDLMVLATANISGNTSIGGALTTGGAIASSSITTTGLADIGTTLRVKGNTTLDANLAIGNNLTVSGISNLSATNINGNLQVSNGLVVGGNSSLGNISATSLSLSDDLYVTDSTTLVGPTNIQSNLSVGSNLNVGGEATLQQLEVIGQSVFLAPLVVQSSITQTGSLTNTGLTVNGMATITSNLGVGGLLNTNSLEAQLVMVGSQLISTGSNLLSDVEINGSLVVQAPVYITGNTSITGNLQATNLSGVNTGDEVPASSTVAGIVKTTTDENDPRVYTSTQIDNNFLHQSSVGTVIVPLNNEMKIDEQYLPDSLVTERYEISFTVNDLVNNILVINHELGKRYISSITLWSNIGEKVYPSLIMAISDTQLSIDFSDLNIEGTWFISITK
jgi:UDP-3-O-[3-hydroxymyristoyl] glucosamine N-acyltransferase